MRVTTSLMPGYVMPWSVYHFSERANGCTRRALGLTGVLGIFRAGIFIARVQDILVHQRCPRRHLPEEANFDWLANLDSLSFLHEYLPCIFAPVFTVQTGHTVLSRVVAFFEGLKGSHQVVTTGNAGGNHTLCDTGCDGAFDDGGDGVHGAYDFGLELGGNVEFNLLEKVFKGAEATNDQDVLGVRSASVRADLPLRL